MPAYKVEIFVQHWRNLVRCLYPSCH